MFPVPWSSKWSWSLHLFFGRPMFLRPFGLYRNACFGILIYRFNLLEMGSHFLHNIVTTFAFLFYTVKYFNVWKDKKIKFIKLLKLEVGDVSEVCWVVKYHFLFCGTWGGVGELCGVFLEQYVREITTLTRSLIWELIITRYLHTKMLQ
jgi:hypothetical protein